MSEVNVAPDSQGEFDRLQKKLVPLWKSIERFNQDPQTIVVVPSMSIRAATRRLEILPRRKNTSPTPTQPVGLGQAAKKKVGRLLLPGIESSSS